MNMKEQEYVLKNVKTFELKDIFDCGQCFRWNRESDGSYTGIFGKNVLNVSKKGKDIIFKGICESDIESTCINYFDLNRDYEKIKEDLSKIDDNMKEAIKYGKGIRLLNQDLWETIISFIISANNNIPRIKGIIDRISKKYGNEIIYNGKSYYTFPTVKELSKATVKDLRDLGLGFRDIRVYNTTKMILNNEVDLNKLSKIEDFKIVRDDLLTLDGVGPKVADCILLFSSLKRLEAFPIDVWVRRVMNELYIKEKDETKVNKKIIEKIAEEKFGDVAGLAQQYLFFWKREA